MMSLAPPDTDGSRLDTMRAAGSDAKAVLQALGFRGAAAEGLAALLNCKLSQLGSAEQKQLLAKMGFSEQEIEVILLTSNPPSLKNQAALMRNAPQGLAQYLMAGSKGMNLMAAGQSFDNMQILEQLGGYLRCNGTFVQDECEPEGLPPGNLVPLSTKRQKMRF